MNRKQKIDFLSGLQTGKRSLSELMNDEQELKHYVYVQKRNGLFDGDLTREQIISTLTGPSHVVFIECPDHKGDE